MEAVVYQCPNCGAPLEFNSETQRWDCKFCLSSFEKEQLEQITDEQKKKEEEEQQEQPAGGQMCYHCPNCGAQLITDDSTVATFCTFCGSPTVLAGRLEESFEPKRLIPFKLDKKAAEEALFALCRKKPLLPKDFTSKAHIEKVTGIYVPFWLHDCYVNASLHAQGNRVSVRVRGDTEYTRTDVYDVVREGALTYHNLPTDASKKMDDAMMDALEPFSFRELRKFDMSYLSGYFAQRYDADKSSCYQRMKERIEESAEQQLRKSCTGYAVLNVLSHTADIIKSTDEYVMLPVWLLYTRYHGKDYLFAMNGQTGKMVGDLPLSWLRAAGLTALITAVITLLGTIGGLLLC